MAQYRANHKKWTEFGHATPNVTCLPGDMPNTQSTVAPYLPFIRDSVWDRYYFVISAGTPVALDSNNYIVPAGLAVDLAAEVASPGAGVLAYSQTDVDAGVIGPDGEYVTLAQSVAATLVTAGITISKPFAVLHESAYWAFSDDLAAPANKGVGLGAGLPTRARHHNFIAQTKPSLLCDYVLDVPVVASVAQQAPYCGGQLVFDAVGAAPKPGDLVKINAYSAFVTADPDTDTFADIIGQVIDVDKRFPKGYLQFVQTVYSSGLDTAPASAFEGISFNGNFNTLDAMAGSATEGLSDSIVAAGGSAVLGTVRINLIRF